MNTLSKELRLTPHDVGVTSAGARACWTAGVVWAMLFAPALTAQSPGGAASERSAPAATNDSSRFAALSRRATAWGFRRLPPVNAYNLWVGASMATAAGNNNGRVDGSLRMIAAQWTRDLFSWRRARVSWVTEVLPLMLVTSGAPAGRTPPSLLDPRETGNPELLSRYLTHDSKGFGFSPLSMQAEVPLRHRLSTVIQVTSGVAWFSDIVPYGEASQGNFTVSPGIALQWDVTSSSRVAVGYTLHHTSNMTFAAANPGFNAHVLQLRLTSRRAR